MISGDEILRAAERLPGDTVEIRLELCDVAMAAQTCHNLGIIDETHVATQSYLRLCLAGLGRERDAPEGAFETLQLFSETMQNNHGQSAAWMLHGAGRSGTDSKLSSREYVARRNSGAYHPNTTRARFPATDSRVNETLVYDVLNFMVAARAAETTYLHSIDKRVCLIVTSADAMAIKQGLMFDAESTQIYGTAKGPLSIDDRSRHGHFGGCHWGCRPLNPQSRGVADLKSSILNVSAGPWHV